MQIRPRRIVAALGVVVIVIGCYVGLQLNSSRAANLQTQVSAVALDQTPPSVASTSQEPAVLDALKNSKAPVSTSGTPSSVDYKQSMSKTYQQTLQAMENIKSNTLALKSKQMSLSSYKASILESQTTFSLAEAYVRANPPTDTMLNTSYQELLGGISLAKQAMAVVLKGISSFSVSKLYSAREMGITAQQQVLNGYSHL
ncbi:MAG TPA: hypothetical protein VFC84_14230 [Desulfosporosinus sp.]|nr:hypothetical protein [Desulfosporosinus sp.]